MAEEPNGTQQTTGQQETAAPGSGGPGHTSVQSGTPSDVAGGGSSAPQFEAVQAELAELRAQSERYKQQLQGWEQQSKRHLDENAALREQLTQTQTQLQGIGQALTGAQPGATQPQTAADAMDRYLAGDVEALNKFFASATAPQQDTRTIVNEQLQAALGVLQRQQVPFQLHPELADAESPVRQSVFESYAQLEQDPTVRMLYPTDQSMLVPLVGPDGQQRAYDIRVLNHAAMQAKQGQAAAHAAQDERRRQLTGDAASAGGPLPDQEIDPAGLFTASELQQFADPVVLKGLPPEAGSDARSVAKWLVESMTPAEKGQRMQQARLRQQAAAV